MRYFLGTGARVLGVAVLAAVASGGMAALQFTNNTPQLPSLSGDPLDRSHAADEQPYVAREMQARQLKRLREQHQKEVFNDTNRLVELATALKQEMLKGDRAPGDALKDVDEIGKLAKRVSDRIKTQ